MQKGFMKLVKVEIELGIDDENCGDNHEDIACYLNKMLYNDPEFFGEFGKENITSVEEFE
jgi:predicted metal-dependent TIM-barrel fold hydrolase